MPMLFGCYLLQKDSEFYNQKIFHQWPEFSKGNYKETSLSPTASLNVSL